jgi:hypothetical protein
MADSRSKRRRQQRDELLGRREARAAVEAPPEVEEHLDVVISPEERGAIEQQTREPGLPVGQERSPDHSNDAGEMAKDEASTETPAGQVATTSQALEKFETGQADDRATELERLRKLMAERESQEIEEAKIPAPPRYRRVSDPVRQEEINRATDALLANFPTPTEITFDRRDVDAPVHQLKVYGEAAEKCSEYSYAFGGLAAVYHWRMGQCFQAIRDELAPKGKWMEWYTNHGFDKSAVSRDMRLFSACPDGDRVLIGYSEAAAHRGQVAAKLKRFGIEQPATDFFFWVIEQIPQEA